MIPKTDPPTDPHSLALALQLRLIGGAAAEDLMGPIAIDADDVARRISSHTYDSGRRREWIEALRPTWEAIDLSPGSRSALAKLEDPDCQLVMAGQQPALWGGPLLCTMKLLAATRLVADLESRGIPAVALFWIADDDHDTGELDPGLFRSGHQVDNPYPSGRVPISRLKMETLWRAGTEEVNTAITGAPDASAVMQLLDDCDASGDSPSQQFLRILQSVIPDEEWLPVFPRDLRRLQWPWIEKAFHESVGFQHLIRDASEEQQRRGVPAPVKMRQGAPFFFINSQGERVRPEKTEEFSAAKLLEHSDNCSADALLRSVVQDGIFEPAAVILGPTEWCYTLQTRKVRSAWKIHQPLWLPRPRLRPLEAEIVAGSGELGIGLERLLPGLDVTKVISSPRGELKGIELEKAAVGILQRLKELGDGDSSNPSLHRKARKMAQQWRQQLDSLKSAIDLGLDRDVEARRNRLRQLLDQAFPGGLESERSRNLLDLVAWHGPGVIPQAANLISSAIMRWDGSVTPWVLPALTVESKEEELDATAS